MKKIGVFAILFLFLFITLPISLAADEDTTLTDTDTSATQIEKGFECLEAKALTCSGLTTQDIALTILATPDNIFDNCVSELEKKKTATQHWATIEDTAIAILALEHAGKNTTLSENWLLTQERNPTDLTWYIQQDSNGRTECNIAYNTKNYNIVIGEDKKIDSNSIGTCLDTANSDFWLEISSSSRCYDEKFSIKCDKEFMTNLLYKNDDSSTLYILEGSKTNPALTSTDLEVKSKCFGSSKCDYEATAWATMALLKTGHSVEKYIPYLIATADTNEEYLPEAFIYMLTNYEDYATQLIDNQDQLRGYWDTNNPSNTRYYDTALALIALGGSSSEQITSAKNKLLYDQGTNGCWQNSVKDTAIVLWALAGRAGRISEISGESNNMEYCSQAGYFCISSYDCPISDNLGSQYSCGSLSNVCCKTENLKTCSEYGGEKCASGKTCSLLKKSSDITECCTGTCKEATQESECEENSYSCMDSCSEYQESVSSYSCEDSKVCCRSKTRDNNEASLWWIWILILLILIVLVGIGYVYRDKLKKLLSKIKKKPKKGKTNGGIPPMRPRSGMPPRPGFPPIRRPMPPVAQMRQRPSYQDKAMSDTFSKLKEMSS